MKKKVLVTLMGVFLVACGTNSAVQPEEKVDEVVKEEVKEVKEEVKEESTPEESVAETPVEEEPVAQEPEVVDNTAALQAELNELIAQKEALINEKQTIGSTMRGQEKGQRMREINEEISRIGQRIGEIKAQLGY